MTVKEFRKWLKYFPKDMEIEDINGIRVEFPTDYHKEEIKTGFEELSDNELKDLLNKELGMPLNDYEKLMEEEIRKKLEFV